MASTEKTIKITNKQQFDRLVDIMEKNVNVARGLKFAGGFNVTREKYNDVWQEVTTALNSLGPPIRSTTAWQKATYGKKYADTADEASRKGIFVLNRNHIIEQNKLFTAGTQKFGLKCNEYADYTDAEFNTQLKGILTNRPVRKPDTTFIDLSAPTNESVDYKATANQVTGVRSQGKCGASYAFAVTAVLEIKLGITKKTLIILSEQQIIDCSIGAGNTGCDGGTAQNAFTYLQNIGGLTNTATYPYVSDKTEQASTCTHKSGDKTNIQVTSYIEIPEGENYLKAALQKGPVVAAIDASSLNFRFYSIGVFNDPSCKKGITDLDHYVAVVGYAKSSRGEYWIVKNSWGTNWGFKGYGRIARDGTNHCGIATDVTYPITAVA